MYLVYLKATFNDMEYRFVSDISTANFVFKLPLSVMVVDVVLCVAARLVYIVDSEGYDEKEGKTSGLRGAKPMDLITIINDVLNPEIS